VSTRKKWLVFPERPGEAPSSLSKSWLGRHRYRSNIDASIRLWQWWFECRESGGPKFRRKRTQAINVRDHRRGRRWYSGHSGMAPFQYRRLMKDILS
jgi:hypothetical protein